MVTPAACPAEVRFVTEIPTACKTVSPALTAIIPKPKDTERYDREVKIAAIITDYLDGSGGFFRADYLSFVTTLEGFDKIVPDYKYWSFDVNINTECTPEIDEEMTAFLKSFNAGKLRQRRA